MDDNTQLYERAKELECIYQVEEILKKTQQPFPEQMKELTELIPQGFMLPTACRIKITIGTDAYFTEDFARAKVLHRSPLMAGYVCVGEITMGYIQALLPNNCELLINEVKLLDTIANRISIFALDKQRTLFSQWIQEQSPKLGDVSDDQPAPIPKNIKSKNILFAGNAVTANRLIDGITHLVYINETKELAPLIDAEFSAIEEVLERLNDLLPWRHFLFIARNTCFQKIALQAKKDSSTVNFSSAAALIEMIPERQKTTTDSYLPAFFSQKLTDKQVARFSLDLNNQGNTFQESYLRHSQNLLSTLLPTFDWLADIIKVIEIPANSAGKTLSLHMNTVIDQAIAFFTEAPPTVSHSFLPNKDRQKQDKTSHWQWRHYMAKQVANALDMDAFCVKGLYLFGSTNTGEAGMGSDIDLLIHVGEQTATQKRSLEDWLDGWSQALASMNYLQTGYQLDRLLDVHLVTDENIRQGDSFAIKIHSIIDPPETLRLAQPQKIG